MNSTILNEESIAGWLDSRAGWKRDGESITKLFTFPSFRDSIVFVNRVATIADTVQHHPDIEIRNRKVFLSVTTHDAGGLTETDFDLAQRVDFANSH
jgi:4a-hydroxytetrahydrobiopterin dehydratase